MKKGNMYTLLKSTQTQDFNFFSFLHISLVLLETERQSSLSKSCIFRPLHNRLEKEGGISEKIQPLCLLPTALQHVFDAHQVIIA